MSVGANGVTMHVVLDANRRRVRARSVNSVRCVGKRVDAPQIFRGAMHFARVAVLSDLCPVLRKTPLHGALSHQFPVGAFHPVTGRYIGMYCSTELFFLNKKLTDWNRERVGALVNALT
jgi:hypothetical protein